MPVYNLCRICLTEDMQPDMQPLFVEKNARCEEIVRQIEECGGIVLKAHEEFPKMICKRCLESLDSSYKFRSMCQASEHALLDAIVKSELKTEPLEAANSPVDSENEIFFDLRTEFIDAEEVDLSEITDNREHRHFSSGDEDGEESAHDYIVASDTGPESTADELDEKPIRRRIVKTKRKLPPPRTPGKRGRPRAGQAATVTGIVQPSNRGRKKIEDEPSSIMCEICGNIYSKRSLLNMHMRRHMADKPFECEICGKTFACPSEIGRHMRVHTGEKPYSCRFCGRTFADRSTNIKHERIHTNTRPFTCTTCGKSFTYSNVLKNHMLTHTGEKPFSCIACNKTFSRKHQLDQHISTITHQQTVKNIGHQNITNVEVVELQQ